MTDRNREENRGKSIFIHYIRDRFRLILAYGLIVLVLFILTVLYKYEKGIANMSYAVIIILFFFLCAAIPDYMIYRHRCRKLYDALDNGGESDYLLPEPKGYVEELYYKIVCETQKDKRKLISNLDEKKQDMADYYTMWIHQIKTPIAALKLVLGREREENSSGRRAKEELFKIERYAEMALHYARLDSMSADMLFKEYEVAGIIRQAVKKYSILFIGSGLGFTMEEFSCRAITDEKWLGFVVEQVLSNALKYTDTGGISIYGAEENGERVKEKETAAVKYVVIEDTGIGIRECDLPRVFERGFTGYNGRMGMKSTGIGLYLCREIMDKLAHTIKIESTVGKGTRVFLGFQQDM